MSTGVYAEVTPLTQNTRMLPADGITAKSIGLALALNRRYDACIATSTDTIAHVVELILLDGSNTTVLGTATLPAGAGGAGTPGVDLLGLALPAVLSGIAIKAVSNFQVRFQVAIQATFQVDFTLVGGYLTG